MSLIRFTYQKRSKVTMFLIVNGKIPVRAYVKINKADDETV